MKLYKAEARDFLDQNAESMEGAIINRREGAIRRQSYHQSNSCSRSQSRTSINIGKLFSLKQTSEANMISYLTKAPRTKRNNLPSNSSAINLFVELLHSIDHSHDGHQTVLSHDSGLMRCPAVLQYNVGFRSTKISTSQLTTRKEWQILNVFCSTRSNKRNIE